jgi:hypothetical protein
VNLTMVRALATQVSKASSVGPLMSGSEGSV